MAKIGQTQYDADGRLMAPQAYLVSGMYGIVEKVPTTQPGFYHYFEIRARSEVEKLDKIKAFRAQIDAADGRVLFATERTYLGQMETRITYVVE